MNNKIIKRIEWIDFLKGFAALLVIVSHFWENGKQLYGYVGNENVAFEFLDFITIDYLDIGKIGVCIFFIISGYLTANIFKKRNKKEFIIDRCKRLYPMYWLSILLALILIGIEPFYKILVNMTMMQQFVGISNIVGVFWTLQIDWIFYIVCIIMAFLGIYEKKKGINLFFYTFLFLSVIMSGLRFYTGKNLPVAISILLAATFIGIMIKRNENENETEKYNVKISVISFFITLLPTVMLAYTEHFTNFKIGIRYYITYILAFTLFFVCKKIINKKSVFTVMGKNSYSLYLMHPTIGFFCMNKLFTYLGINICINMIVSFIVTFVCSIITGKYIENIFSKKKVSEMKVYINGRFLTQSITGVQRYAIEVLKELDKNNLNNKFIVLVPKNSIIQKLELNNIEIKEMGMFKGHLWEQISLPLYILKNNQKTKLLNMCNLAPILYPGYTVIHDISFKTHPEHLNWKFSIWYKFITKMNIKRYKHIFTVSEFSKKEIIENYKIKPEKITVTYNSAEHMKNIEPDQNILKKIGIENKDYYFSLGSKSPHKNHEFIIKCAKNNPQELFIVSGNNNSKIFKDEGIVNLKNLIYTGYLNDNQLVSLYKNCKAFIFPSLYEGFGIPPLEALECGCENIYLSDIEVFKEIYGNTATYLHVQNNKFDLDSNHKEFSKKNVENLLQKFSWKNVAKTIMGRIGE